jgi:serine/threonine protein kinase
MLFHLLLTDIIFLCSDQLPIYVITEYMSNGDLRTFLRACRPASANPRQVLTNADLFAIAQKAVAAMVFLESKHIVHRELAAKYYLVGHDATDIRLANLGKSRDIDVRGSLDNCRFGSKLISASFLQTELYSTVKDDIMHENSSIFYGTYATAGLIENEQPQETRWMAPECIRGAEFLHKSDVWAMGVVIYEVQRD